MTKKDNTTSDDIIELVDIVQKPEAAEDMPPVVDFEGQLSGLLSKKNQTISLDDAPGLDEILGSNGSTEAPASGGALDKSDSSPEDLDALLDNLFSEEEDKDASPENKGTSTQKEAFLEKALEGIDDIDVLIAEAESSSSPEEGNHSFSEVLKEEERALPDLEEIEAILDSAMPKTEGPKEGVGEQLADHSVAQPEQKIADLNKGVSSGKLEEELQSLKKQIATLELIVMDHEAEVEELQERNCKRLEALEARVEESFAIETLAEKVAASLQGSIDKAAAEAAVRIIREEVAALRKGS